jgi:hypothetical protein
MEESLEVKKSKDIDVADLLKKAFIVFVFFLLIVSVWGLYSSFNQLISIWIEYKYAPIYRVILNFAVVLVSLYTLQILLREYRSK